MAADQAKQAIIDSVVLAFMTKISRILRQMVSTGN